MNKFRHMALLIIFLSILLANNAFAVAVWDWDFTNSGQTWSTTDAITLEARLYNDPSSTSNIGNISGFGLWGGDFNSAYLFSSEDFFGQFSGLLLAPGESFDFIFGTFTPFGGEAPAVSYAISDSQLTIFGNNTIGGKIFEATVVATVPEPASILLLGAGLVGLVSFRKKVSR